MAINTTYGNLNFLLLGLGSNTIQILIPGTEARLTRLAYWNLFTSVGNSEVSVPKVSFNIITQAIQIQYTNDIFFTYNDMFNPEVNDWFILNENTAP
jgi:hypothetical protein